ncbi:Cystathionine beta-lyase family protein involved in aluminum resistance [Salinibacillus kushneri]|uniref:Cystathionine beta-lyase family protein involved in aluminum resistance n=1 Tax=Salinibacillus kushneri TaxID=237682 RepID=A0A1I0E3Q4_9BACI|nr:methionine gamma-lyase family protein [Salinibacillus kushneri]SET38966.1 Cystathionine beta-lyase family protein involved in aluminum resistance [Salinibacillus kushneri]
MEREAINKAVELTETEIAPYHQQVQTIVEANQRKVLNAFQKHQVSDTHFNPTTGYGYDDLGREVLERVFADVFGTEDALVRPQIISGTHAITLSLFGVLRPGDELLYITGKPYDTLEEIVGVRGEGKGSLKDFQIHYQHIDLKENGYVDYDMVKESIHEHTKMIAIQRSKGYDNRPSFTVQEMREMIDFVKSMNPRCIVFVDNCYGEFVELDEPTDIGADLMAGSLIKNPGGGLAKTGGYIVGRQHLIEKCASRLTAPGLGKEAGATLYSLQEMFQGLFMAPHIVGESLKGAIFTSRILEKCGFHTKPSYKEWRTDLIQSVNFPDEEMMVAFCQAIQKASPINSHVVPYPSPMPGYEHDVIMAAGTFVQGASIELSADGPIRPPYTAYIQGGLTYEHVKIAVISAIETMVEKGFDISFTQSVSG